MNIKKRKVLLGIVLIVVAIVGVIISVMAIGKVGFFKPDESTPESIPVHVPNARGNDATSVGDSITEPGDDRWCCLSRRDLGLTTEDNGTPSGSAESGMDFFSVRSVPSLYFIILHATSPSEHS